MTDVSDLDDLGEPDEDRLVETGERPTVAPGPDDDRPVEVGEDLSAPVPDDDRLVEPTGAEEA